VSDTPATVKLYAFEWEGGCYNFVYAKNVKEAYTRAVDKGKPDGLVPNRGTFTSKPEFMERLVSKWSEP
jgi:hypothetical protein